LISFIISTIKIIFLLGFLIFIHEGGHFLVAKACKIRVNEFAIGFGPTIWKKQGKETKYALRLIPLGGFVNMLGEEERSEEEGSFSKASIPKRIAVVLAGGIVNILFALIVYFTLVSCSGNYISTTIDSTVPGYASEVAGIEVGDKILKINNKKVRLRSDIDEQIQKSNGNEMIITVERNGKEKEIKLVPTVEETKNKEETKTSKENEENTTTKKTSTKKTSSSKTSSSISKKESSSTSSITNANQTTSNKTNTNTNTDSTKQNSNTDNKTSSVVNTTKLENTKPLANNTQNTTQNDTQNTTSTKNETTTPTTENKNTSSLEDTKTEEKQEEPKRVVTLKRNETYINKLKKYIEDKGYIATEDASIVEFTNPFTYSSFNIDGYLIGKKSYSVYARDFYVNGVYQWTQCFII